MRPAMLAAAVATFTLGTIAGAQETGRSFSISGSVGLGLATQSGIGGLAALSVSTRSGDFVVRAASSAELDFFDDADVTSDIALLYGSRRRTANGWSRAAIGIGSVRYTIESAECCAVGSKTTVGLAGQYDLAWLPSPFLGLGLAGFANLNSGRSFAGVVVSLHLGALR